MSTPFCLFLSMTPHTPTFFFFFFNDTATTEIYTLSLHDALPIWAERRAPSTSWAQWIFMGGKGPSSPANSPVFNARASSARSEEHTSELQSPDHLVCRLLLEKKKKPHSLRCVSHRLESLSLHQRA